MDRKRMFTGASFWIGLLLAFLAFVFGGALPELKGGTPLPSGSFLSFFGGAFDSKILPFLLPVASVLPYGDGYLRECQQGFWKAALVRCGRWQYLADKVLTVSLGGMLIWIGGGTLALFGSFLFFFPLEAKGMVEWMAVVESFGKLARVCLTGGILANCSAFFAAVSGSYYLAFGLPFVCDYLLVILNERYFPGAYVVNPGEWIQGKEFWGDGNLGLYFFLILLLLGTMAAHGAALFGKLGRMEE